VAQPDVQRASGYIGFPAGVGGRGQQPLVGVAVAGVVVGHLLTYLLLVPGPARAGVLHHTGHAYFPLAVRAALVVAALSLGSWFLRAITRRRGDAADSSLFARLARLQLAGFAAMEITERVTSGTPLIELVHDHIVLGLAVQVAVAWLAARVLTALDRVAEVISGTAENRAPRPVLAALVLSGLNAVGRLVPAAAAARAPPRAPAFLSR
jgi:hypothetical protein